MNYTHPEIVLRQAPKEIGSSSLNIRLPKISVIVTCFNYGRYVGQALDSVASQTYGDFECVVVDDTSTDDSALIVQQWIDINKDPRFRMICSASNSGQTASFAVGLAATSGDFVAFLDADDFWFPEFLKRHVEAHLNRSFPVSLSCSDLVQVNDEGRVLSGTGGRHARPVTTIDADRSVHIDGDNTVEFRETPKVEFISPSYSDVPWSATSGMMFRRSALNLVMPDAPNELRVCTDGYAFAICHYFTGSLAISSALGAYRRHGNNNFFSNPLIGDNLPCALPTINRHIQSIVRVMVQHLLDHYDRFATEFPDERIRNLLRILFRKSLQIGVPIPEARLRGVIGARRMIQDKVSVKLSFFRQLVSRLRAQFTDQGF